MYICNEQSRGFCSRRKKWSVPWLSRTHALLQSGFVNENFHGKVNRYLSSLVVPVFFFFYRYNRVVSDSSLITKRISLLGVNTYICMARIGILIHTQSGEFRYRFFLSAIGIYDEQSLAERIGGWVNRKVYTISEGFRAQPQKFMNQRVYL